MAEKARNRHQPFYIEFAGTDLKVKAVKLLSEGAFAYVYLARQSKTSDKFFAMKKITP